MLKPALCVTGRKMIEPPQNRSYSLKINKKIKKLRMKSLNMHSCGCNLFFAVEFNKV